MAKPRKSSARTDGGSPGLSTGPMLPGLVLGLSLVSLAAHLLFSGSSFAWGLAPLEAAWPSWLFFGALAAAAIVCSLYAFERIDRSTRPAYVRAGGIVGILTALSICLLLLGPESHIGDWQYTLGVVLKGEPLGKWYGASLLLILFDRTIGRLLSLEGLESIKLATSILGACSAWVYYVTIREFALDKALRAWPFLYLSGFGAIGVGLAHVEIYAIPVLALGLTILTGVRVLRDRSPRRIFAFSLCAGIALVSYLGMMLLLPAIAGVFIFVLRGTIRNPSPMRILAAVAGGALVALPLLLALLAGPEPMDRSLLTFWAEQVTPFHGERNPPCFLPQDVHWSPTRNLIHPRHWFSSWHIRDISQFIFLGDRLGLLLSCALLPLLWRRRGPLPETLFLAGTALTFLGFGATVCNGRTYPWDMDLISCVFVPTSIMAVMLLARRAGNLTYSKRFGHLLASAGLIAFLGGYMLFSYGAEPPTRFGPPTEGISVAVTPDPLALVAGSCANIQIWIRNERNTQVRFEPSATRVMVAGPLGRWAMTHDRGIQPVIGTRVLDPGEVACHVNFEFSPAPFGDNPTPSSGTHRASWIVQIDGAGDHLLNLRSQEVDLELLDAP